MDSRDFSVVVYGASGFTGQFVALEVLQSIMEGKQIRWAVAGRNRSKLEALVATLRRETGFERVNEVRILEADITDPDALLAMCKSTKVVINCVGPYRLYGEPVVKACVNAGTHYVDVSGEPEFLERMQVSYHNQAAAKKIHIVGSCGFDSLPIDVGVEHLRINFPGELTSVESYLNYYGGLKMNYGTFESLVLGVGSRNNLKDVRKQIYKEKMQYLGQQSKVKSGIFFSDKEQKYTTPFPGADASVVRRSQYHLSNAFGKTPVRLNAYVCWQSLLQVIGAIFFGIIVFTLSQFEYGRAILLKHPLIFSFGVFSKDGLTRKEIDERSACITLYGKGFASKEEAERKNDCKPDKQKILKIKMPEPGYVGASIFCVQSAFTILEDQLPNSGGVLTPAGAFHGTSIVSRLEKRGIRFIMEP